MAEIVCPSCRKRIHPPDHLAGRRVTCPRCNAVVVVPAELIKVVEEVSTAETSSSIEEPSFPKSVRLGILALGLGLVSILFLCLPFIGYLSIGLSCAGLVAGFLGCYHARKDENASLPSVVATGAGVWDGFGARARDYPLAGVAACLLALILALLPMLFRLI
ncbi:MAG: hypothetical protein ACYC3I_24845 [Gemmataceae bacterium]